MKHHYYVPYMFRIKGEDQWHFGSIKAETEGPMKDSDLTSIHANILGRAVDPVERRKVSVVIQGFYPLALSPQLPKG